MLVIISSIYNGQPAGNLKIFIYFSKILNIFFLPRSLSRAQASAAQAVSASEIIRKAPKLSRRGVKLIRMKIFIPTIIKINSLYYFNIIDLITSISLVCTKKYSTRGLIQKRKRLTSVERSKIIIPIESPIHESIIGLLLGDGHIQKRSVLGNSRFIYAQSSLRLHHINYFKHVLELFKPYLSNDFNYKEKTFTDKRTNKEYKSVHFATLSLPCFNYYRDMFYDSNNLKIVPLNIKINFFFTCT